MASFFYIYRNLFTTAWIILFCFFCDISANAQKDKQAEALSDRASMYLDNSNFSQAELVIDSLMTYANEHNDNNVLANAYNFKGALNRELSRSKEAIYFYTRSIETYEKAKNQVGIAGGYVNIGAIYAGLDEFKIALSYYFKAHKIYTTNNYESKLGILSNNIGTIYQKLKQIPSSNVYLRRAFEAGRAKGDSMLMAMATHNLGVNYLVTQTPDSAISYFNKSLGYVSRYDEGPGHIFNYEQLGAAYLLKKDYGKAGDNFNRAMQISERTGITSSKMELSRQLSEVAENKSNYKEALKFLKDYLLLKDSTSIEKLRSEVLKTEFENELKQQKKLQQQEQKNRDAISKAKIEAQNKVIMAVVVALIVVLFLVAFVFKEYRQKKKANDIISKQKELVEQKNTEILSSISYAKRIQSALLTSDLYLKKHLPDFFVLYKPKDIVSGDFYWGLESKGVFYLVVADCTGHGVPGAFMSLLNISILNEIIIERNISEPDKILNEARKDIIRSLNPEGGDESKDGMDCILCAFDFKANKLKYACANNSFYLVRNGEVIVSETNKMPVGKSHDDTIPFTKHELSLQKGDTLYLITDGYADQFGGPKGKKFKYKQLQEEILKASILSTSEQKEKLSKVFEDWKGALEQVDDVCIVGLKV